MESIPTLTEPAAVTPGPTVTIAQIPQKAVEPGTALERLAADLPYQKPEETSAAGQKDYADKSFNLKLGAKTGDRSGASNGSSASSPGSGSGGSDSDDGGGPNYPHRLIKFLGAAFRSLFFRPNIPVASEIIRALDLAKTSAHIALYEFNLRKDQGILNALRRAKARGVDVRIILDYSHVFPQGKPDPNNPGYEPKRTNEIWALLREGFNVKTLRGLGQYGIMHNKLAVIDYNEKDSPQMAIFGSYNWSWPAEESHYENAHFNLEKKRIKILKAYWDWMDSLSQPVYHHSKPEDYTWPNTFPSPPIMIEEDILFNGIALPFMVLSPNREPGKSLEDRLVRTIGATKKSIKISIFAVESVRIAEALAQALARKVRVQVIFDESQAYSKAFGPYAQWLAFHGIELKTLAGPDPHSDFPPAQKSHHKFGVFDEELIETGSPNYTKYSSIANFENGHFINDPIEAAGYSFIFDKMFKRAKLFLPPQKEPALPTDEELTKAALSQPGPISPEPSFPGPGPGIKARKIAFNGENYPIYAFRPDTPIEPILISLIDHAQKSLRLALYEFNLDGVMEALRRAKERGVKIELVIDYSHVYTTGKDHTGNLRKPSAQILALINEGFDILTLKNKSKGIQHNKYAIIDAEDGGIVVFGSYNWAKTAEQDHFENIIINDERDRIEAYSAYFEYQRALASPMDQPKLAEVLTRSPAEDELFQPEGTGYDVEDEVLQRNMELEEDEEEPLIEPESAGFGLLARAPDVPPSPSSPSPSIDFNEESFSRTYFSPQGGIQEAWIRAIKAAKVSIDIAQFGFYSKAIAESLVASREAIKKINPNVKIRLLLDMGTTYRAKIDGVPVIQWLMERGFNESSLKLSPGPNKKGDPMFQKQHNKFMIIDGQLLLDGSFNLSNPAENFNFENENVFKGNTSDLQGLLAGFMDFFERMFEKAERPRIYKPRAPKLAPQPA